MLFKAAILDGIKEGRITLAFRRWTKPTVRAPGTLRTPIGVLAIEDVRELADPEISEEEARRAGFENRAALLADLRTRTHGTLYRIMIRFVGDDPRKALRDRDRLAAEDLAELATRLAKLDRARAGTPWTTACLRLIGEAEGRTAGELAEYLGVEKAVLKRRIRQLKELGLTESLQTGYRLSKRGRALLSDVEKGVKG